MIKAALLFFGLLAAGTGAAWQETTKILGGEEQPPIPVTIATFGGEASALLYIAEERGFFEENGLKIVLQEFSSGRASLVAMEEGETDLSTSSEFSIVRDIPEHDVKILSSVATLNINEILAHKDRGIEKAKDLKGKRIGVQEGSSVEFMLGRFLLREGMDIKDVEMVDLSVQELKQEFLKGNLDAVIIWEPHVTDIKQELEDKVVSWSAEGNAEHFFLLSTSGEWLERNPDAALRILEALRQAELYLKENPGPAKSIIAERLGYSGTYLDRTWERHAFSLQLPQSLLLKMEMEARWERDQGGRDSMPDVLRAMASEPLRIVKPDAVTVLE